MSYHCRKGSILFFGDENTCKGYSEMIKFESLILFVEEIIDYSLRQNNVHSWIPPMNLEYLRLKHANERYFKECIGEAICHSCTETDAVNLATKMGFNKHLWFILKSKEARDHLVSYLMRLLRHDIDSKDSSAFQMFSFACYAVRTAIKTNLNCMANEAVLALIRVCCEMFPYKRQYADYSVRANNYNLGHRLLHSRNDIDHAFMQQKEVDIEMNETYADYSVGENYNLRHRLLHSRNDIDHAFMQQKEVDIKMNETYADYSVQISKL